MPFLNHKVYLSLLSQVIRVLGLLGALDPHKHRINLAAIKESEASASKLEIKLSSQDPNAGGMFFFK